MTARSRPPRGRLVRKRALSRAIREGDLDAIRGLHREDPEIVDAGDSHGNRPLGVAVEFARLDAFELLLELGADVLAKNHGGASELDGIAAVESRAFYDLVVARGVEPSVHQAASAGDLDRLAVLLDGGARTAARLPGQTPLHSAVLGGAEASVQMLVEHGADVEARMHWHDGPYYTPLAMIARCPRAEARPAIATALLEAGTEIDTLAGTFGGTLLHEAIQLGDRPLVELLLERGADVDRQDLAGNTPLHKAVSRGPVAVVEMVLARSPDLTLTTRPGPTQRGGETALQVAQRLKKAGAVMRIEAAAK